MAAAWLLSKCAWPSPDRATLSMSVPTLQAGNDSPVAWPATWSAICTVWASKWSDRAWLSRQAVGLPDQDLFMSVLLQRVVPSQYAFVLHTKNPVSGQQGEMLGEVVVGMGEFYICVSAASGMVEGSGKVV